VAGGAQFLVGIDLGTTNTVVASARIARIGGDDEPEVFAIPQLVTASEVAPRAMLPSVLYAPLDAEGARDPWSDAPWVGGEYARRRGAEVTGRFVASAKSWLAHGAVDRAAPILPWGAGASEATDEGPRISPVDASARYLEHVRRAWDAAHPDAPLAEQEVVLTVPASFDEASRELTLEAANGVGLAPRLLEEPTAAFYDWMRRTGALASLLEGGKKDALVLVCDVGGGTTDLSLIQVARASTPAGVQVTRVAVGRHLLLGGDNMDLALANACEARMTESRLEPARFAQLVAACRGAKESLLAKHAPAEVPIVLAGSGAKLVGSTLRTTLAREEVERIVLDGFWPLAPRDAKSPRSRAALVAFGLPYERDVAVTHHVAEFFARHAQGTQAPAALLLNGGVFRAERIVSRLVESIHAWGASSSGLRVLANADPDLAVARGAVAYALARRGRGVRIEGGAARGYYVEVATGAAEKRAVCVVPRGAKEGETQVARGQPLAITVGRPARFALWASDEASGHAPGDVVTLDPERFVQLPPIATRFGAGDRARDRREQEESVPVVLEGELTEIGTLDLACVESDPKPGAEARRFRLAFALRGDHRSSMTPPPPSVLPRSTPNLDAALGAIDRVFGKSREGVGPRETKDLVRELERLLGERGTWDTAVARALFDALAPGKNARRRSPDHERVFWSLAGFCLRPGFGDPLDASRIEAIAHLVSERLAFPDQPRGWQQFFIAWRRVAAGLDDGRQGALCEFVDPWIMAASAGPGAKKPKGTRPLADPEMLEMAASLERTPPQRRAALGAVLLERTWTDRDPRLWAALGRLGARVPAYASVDHVVAAHVVERWVDHLLREKWDQVPTAVDAAVRLARVTGDRARDLSDKVRIDVQKRLAAAGASAEQVRAVSELVTVEADERATFWGESLPVGLRLV
jgi:molecular chaperone DnaK (HSP70)